MSDGSEFQADLHEIANDHDPDREERKRGREYLISPAK